MKYGKEAHFLHFSMMCAGNMFVVAPFVNNKNFRSSFRTQLKLYCSRAVEKNCILIFQGSYQCRCLRKCTFSSLVVSEQQANNYLSFATIGVNLSVFVLFFSIWKQPFWSPIERVTLLVEYFCNYSGKLLNCESSTLFHQ